MSPLLFGVIAWLANLGDEIAGSIPAKWHRDSTKTVKTKPEKYP